VSEVSVRPAAIQDAPALALLVAALRAHQKDPIGHLNEATIRRDGFGEEREFDILIAERERRPIGYALFTESYEPAFAARGLYLADLYVRPEARRSGAGRALVQAVAAEAKRRERSFLWWTSLAANAEAHAFYAAIGATAHEIRAHALIVDAAALAPTEADGS
jgi:GNAT superfamily N-acetyltransferase